MAKLTINFHTKPDGQGDTLASSRTWEGKGDGSEPEPERPARLRVPPLAMSMTISINDAAPAAEIDPPAQLTGDDSK